MKPRVIRTVVIVTIVLLVGCTAWLVAPPGDRRVTLEPEVRVDRILVEKSLGRMTLFRDDMPVRTYRVAIGSEPGPKTHEGDRRTPEGQYRIVGRNPQSAYHLSLRISYPEPADVEAAQARGVPPGGDIMIHGIPNGYGWLGSMHRVFNWTAGCIAVTNEEIEEIWQLVPDGTPIEIRA